jgi:long-chain acyl-CoA synthetase
MSGKEIEEQKMDPGTILVSDRSMSQKDLQTNARRAATGLISLGLVPGDTVALLLRNDLAFVEATVAISTVGGYAVPLNWHNKPDELSYVLADCGAKILIAHSDLLGPIRSILPPDLRVLVAPTPLDIARDFHLDLDHLQPEPGDVLWASWLAGFAEYQGQPPSYRATFIYTSGTTGRPKGVKRQPATSEQSGWLRDLFRLSNGVRPGMRLYIAGPLYHSAPNASLRQSLALADLIALASRFDPEQLLAAIDKFKLTTLVMVPTMFVRLLQLPEAVRRKYDVSSIEVVAHNGAPCPPDVKRAMIDWWGPVLVETYGGTESGVLTVCTSQDWLEHPGTVGRAAPHVTIKILSEEGRELPAGVVGEIYARSLAYSNFMYHGLEEARKDVDRDGLVTLGDLGYVDADGYLYISDRKRDMIISGGVNIYPAEIEAELLKLSGVQDCAVFGVPDAEFGEQVMALVEPQPGRLLDSDSLRTELARKLSNYKVPRRIEFRETLLREESGKIFKRKLREPYWAQKSTQI